MRPTKLIIRLIAGVTLTTMAFVSTVDARQLSYASGGTQNTIGSKGIDAFAQAVDERSDGDLSVKGYYQSLLGFMETPDGLRDGIADLGGVLTPYFPADFPRTVMLTELTMLLELRDTSAREAAYAYAGAMSDYVMNDCPDCQEEYRNRNQVFLGMTSSTPYNLLCNTPVRSMADLKGKRIRIGGPQWSRWASEMGASPISIPVSDTYEGLDQEVVDCTAHNLPDLTQFNFVEVITDAVLGVPGGVFGGIGNHMNADTWKGLSPENREAILYGSAAIAAKIASLYVQDHKANRQLVEEKDYIEVYQASEEMRNKTQAFIKEDLETIAQRYREEYGIEQSDEMISDFRERLEQWLELVKNIKTNDELRDLYWSEIFSKIDNSQYGM